MKFSLFAAALTASSLAFSGSQAAVTKHPAYLHALHDVHLAYSAISARGGDAAMRPHEQAALSHLHAAADIIRQVAPGEDKSLRYIPAVSTEPSRLGKLHDAKGYILRARSDLNEPESDQSAANLKPQALAAINAAEQEVDAAIIDYQQHK